MLYCGTAFLYSTAIYLCVPLIAVRVRFVSLGREALVSGDHLDDHWITVFGFPVEARSFIMEQFSQYGTILKHVVSVHGAHISITMETLLP